MNPNKKIKPKYWYMKIDLAIWIDSDLECMNTAAESGSESRFRSTKDL